MTFGRFQAPDEPARQAVREWLYWNVDALFPPIFGCYAVLLGERKLLPISVDPVIADYHRRRAETALATLDLHLGHRDFLCAAEPTIADVFCAGDLAFARICGFDLARWTNVERWIQRMMALPGFQAPFELLAMADAEISSAVARRAGWPRLPAI